MEPSHLPAPFWSDSLDRPSAEEWTYWKHSFLDYLDMLVIFKPEIKITEELKIKLLRQSLGREGQRTFDTLNLRAQPTLNDVLAILDKHWRSRVNVFVARFIFSHLKQQAGEPLDAFILRISNAAQSCNYSMIPAKRVEEAFLIQQLISGLEDSKLREILLTEDPAKLTWERACDIVRTRRAILDQNEMFLPKSISSTTSRTKPSTSRSVSLKSDKPVCFRCGSESHKANNSLCPARNIKCRKCGKVGHFARVCRTKTVSQLHTEAVDVQLDESHSDADGIYSICKSNTILACSNIEPKLPSSDIRTVRFILTDMTVKLNMELDTACPITIVPYEFYLENLIRLPIQPSNYAFDSYSKNPVHILGFVIASLSIDGSKSSDVAVYVSRSNSRPLLGRNAMVSLRVCPSLDRMVIASISAQDLKLKFPNLFKSDLGKIPNGKHRIKLQPQAKSFAISQPRPIPLSKREAVSKALQDMVQDDVIEPIQCSEWVHPLVAVLKKDGSVRICTDLRKLNRQLIVEKFPLPTADELIVKLSGSKVFSKLDIRNAYFHMPLTDESRPLTAFLTPAGLYQYKVLPMGLSSAPAAWQKFITLSLADLPGCIAYMDDIAVFGRNSEEHREHLHAVLRRLNDLNLRLNVRKCQFAVEEIEFLGLVISNRGVRPGAENTRAILECPIPENAEQIKHFLGLCSYYLRHLANFSTIAEPLRRLTKQGEPFEWGCEQDHSYQTIRTMVASSPTVAIFDEHCPTFVSTDASNVGLGAVLSQVQNGSEHVIAYASRTLSDSEKNYSTSEKEALACVWACEKWHLYLFGRPFTLRTDHSALTALLCRGNKGQRPLRISRWYSRLLNYDFEIQYVPGSKNQIPDALSRLPLKLHGIDDSFERNVIASVEKNHLRAISKRLIQENTNTDVILSQVRKYTSDRWPEKKFVSTDFLPYFVVRNELSIVDQCVMRGNRFVVPSSVIHDVITCAHEGHPGIVRTKAKIREFYWWPKMNSSVEAAVRNCPICQNADKSVKPVQAPIQPILYPMRPWAKIALDIMGPFRQALPHKKNMLVATCFYTKWPEAALFGEITSKTVIKWLRYLFARFGLPEEVVTENGPQFRSHEFETFLSGNDIKHNTPVPYNPPANGMVERLNRTLKESIQAIQLQGEDWEEALVTALGNYRTTPHTATSKTPAELMFGRRIRTKLNARVEETVNADEIKRREDYQARYRKTGRQLNAGTYVRQRKLNSQKGEKQFTDPVKIIRASTPGTYHLQDGSKVNARRLVTTLSDQIQNVPELRTNNENDFIRNTHSPLVRRSKRTCKPVDRFL